MIALTLFLHPCLPVVRDRRCILAWELATHAWPWYWHLWLWILPEVYEPLDSKFWVAWVNFSEANIKQKSICWWFQLCFVSIIHSKTHIDILCQNRQNILFFFFTTMQFNSCPLNLQSLSVHVLLLHALSSFHVFLQCSPLHGGPFSWLAQLPLGARWLWSASMALRILINLFIKDRNTVFCICSCALSTAYSSFFKVIVVRGVFVKWVAIGTRFCWHGKGVMLYFTICCKRNQHLG